MDILKKYFLNLQHKQIHVMFNKLKNTNDPTKEIKPRANE